MRKLKIAGIPSQKSKLQTLHDAVSDITNMIEALKQLPDSGFKKRTLAELETAALSLSRWRYAQQDVDNDLRMDVP